VRTPLLATLVVTISVFVGCGSSSSIPPLILAVDGRDAAQVERLLAGGANPNQLAPSGSSALREAVVVNDPVIIKILLEAGAKPSVEAGLTLVMVAARRPATGSQFEDETIEVIKLLLAAGVDPCTRATRPKFAGMRASQIAANDEQQMVKSFLEGVEVACKS
jgi:ankyrin repeat protein